MVTSGKPPTKQLAAARGEQPAADQSVDSLKRRLGPAPEISVEEKSRRFLQAAGVLDCDEAEEHFRAWLAEVERSRS
jgi:hypothetical protein